MKISLGNLEKSRLTLSEKDMEHLLGGGGGVRCGCLYANSGGATHQANHDANEAAGLWTVPPDGSDSSGSPTLPNPGNYGGGWNGVWEPDALWVSGAHNNYQPRPR